MEYYTCYYKKQGPQKLFQYILCGDTSANGFSCISGICLRLQEHSDWFTEWRYVGRRACNAAERIIVAEVANATDGSVV